MTDIAQNALAAKRVGQYLIDAKVLKKEQLEEALDRQKRMSKAGFHVLLGTILEEMSAIDRQSLEAIILRQRLDEGSVNLGAEADWSPYRAIADSTEESDVASGSEPDFVEATDESSPTTELRAADFVPPDAMTPSQEDFARTGLSPYDAPSPTMATFTPLDESSFAPPWTTEDAESIEAVEPEVQEEDEGIDAQSWTAWAPREQTSQTEAFTSPVENENEEGSDVSSLEAEPRSNADTPTEQVAEATYSAEVHVGAAEVESWLPPTGSEPFDEPAEGEAAEPISSTESADPYDEPYEESPDPSADLVTPSGASDEDAHGASNAWMADAQQATPSTRLSSWEVTPASGVSPPETQTMTPASSETSSWPVVGAASPVEIMGFRFSRRAEGLSETEVSAVLSQLVRRTRALEEQVGNAKEDLAHLDSMRRYGEENIKAADTIAEQIRQEAEQQAAIIRDRAQQEALKTIAEARNQHAEMLSTAGEKAKQVARDLAVYVEEHREISRRMTEKAQSLIDGEATA